MQFSSKHLVIFFWKLHNILLNPFVKYLIFFYILLLLISNLISLQSEIYVYSVYDFNNLKLTETSWWLSIWPIFINVEWTLEMNVLDTVIGYSVWSTSSRSGWLIMRFNLYPYWFFPLLSRAISDRSFLNSLNIIVGISISSFTSFSLNFMYI